MQFGTMFSLVCALLATIGFAWQRQWLLAGAFFFSLCYTVFDKVFTGVLPVYLVDGFSFTFLALTLIYCWRIYRARKLAHGRFDKT
jgi:hypothetical protein